MTGTIHKEVTVDEILSILDYDKDLAVFYWKKYRSSSARKGQLAGYDCLGYSIIKIKQVRYQAHRLVWLIETGKWPEYEIDHIDGNKLNNHISNLRDVPVNVNRQNIKRACSSSSTGLLGVFPYCSGRYLSKITVGNKTHRVGVYDTAEEAHQAYVAAKRIHHEGCTI
jgi:hypothetical protein